jgi:DNA-directed RNA polymerase specialized sigma24 family protein
LGKRWRGKREPFSDPSIWRALAKRIGRVTSRPNDGEDLLHSAYERLDRYRQTSAVEQPEAFLLRTARHLAIDDSRKASARNLARPIDEFHDLADDAPLQDEVFATSNVCSW